MRGQIQGHDPCLSESCADIATSPCPSSPQVQNGDDGTGLPDDLAQDYPQSMKRTRTNDNSPQQQSRKKRALTACEVCRARKTKCSNDRPKCRYCTESGSNCVYVPHNEDQLRDATSQLILSKLDEIMDRLNGQNIPKEAVSESTKIQQSNPNLVSELSTPSIVSPAPLDQSSEPYDDEELRVPSARASADSVLLWPIFKGKYPPNFFISCLFVRSFPITARYNGAAESLDPLETFKDMAKISIGVSVEDNVVRLVDAFSILVYPKNPILNPVTLRQYAQVIEENGIGWDDGSCLVLLACAVGSMAVPLSESKAKSTSRLNGESISLTVFSERLQVANFYYKLACKRIGLLNSTIVKAQCHFLLGIYHSYVFQPVEAWQSFVQASISHQTYLQGRTISGAMGESNLDSTKEREAKGLEQCLYWSSFRSECDMRLQLPVLQYTTDFRYPYMFPTPPEVHVLADANTNSSTSPSGKTPNTRMRYIGISKNSPKQPTLQIQQWEQNWFFYFTEITLRRIGNRILNTLYKSDNIPGDRLNILEIIKLVVDFENQLTAFHERIPTLLYFEKDQRIIPQEELPMITRGRYCEICSSLYRPILYYALCHDEDDIYQSIIKPFVTKCLVFGFWFIDQIAQLHRHHGTWFSVHHGTSIALATIAASRCGHIEMPHGWEQSVQSQIMVLRYWEKECPAFSRARLVIEEEFEASIQ